MNYKAHVLTISDKASESKRVDTSGDRLISLLNEIGFIDTQKTIVNDDKENIVNALNELVKCEYNLILTTGGTGFSKRDNTPEATSLVVDRLAMGIPEAMRAKSLLITNRAMLSRAIAGIKNDSIIINMPGSEKACIECFDVIKDSIFHALDILLGTSSNCAR